MTTRKRWTEEEDRILVQAIEANPHNKAKVFREIAARVNHSENSCKIRWYNALSNPESKHYIGCAFSMISRKSKLDNRTINNINTKTTPTKTPKGLWQKIKTLLNLH